MIFTAPFFRKSGYLRNLSKYSRLNSDKNVIRQRLLPFLGAMIVFVVSLCVLYLGENVGLSDNGDFRRVLLTNNIEYKDSDNHYYLFKQDYRMKLSDNESFAGAVVSAWQTNNEEEIYKSPHFFIIKLSKVLNVIGNKISGAPLTDYNIAYMAVMYCLMLALASGAIFTFFAESSLRLQTAVFALFIFIFCDAGYLLYFNSFYGEPLQYVSLMLIISFGMMIYKRPSIPKVIGFFVSLYFFAGAKLANIVFSLIAAVFAFIMVIMRNDRRFKLAVIGAGILCIISIMSLYVKIPDWMNEDTTYQAVFLGVTQTGDDPRADMRELGIDEDYAVLAGTHAYMSEDEYPIDIKSDEFKAGFYDKVSKFDIAVFYMKHPVRLIKELYHAVENSAYIRPPSVGNSETVPMELTNKASGWSHLRVRLKFLYEPWFIFTAFVMITLYMIFMNVFYIHNHKIESPKRRYMIFSLDILILGLWINLVLPVLCNGEADIAKHMFLFTNCVDILFALGIASLVMCPLRRGIKIAAAGVCLTALLYIDIPKETMTFGSLNGEPIKWEISERCSDGTILLVSKKPVGYMPFDEASNYWPESDLRGWLNNGFLDEFSAEDRERIVKTKNKNILTYDRRYEKEGGDHAHYWNYTPSLVNDGGKTAYYNYTEDEVFIPTLAMMEEADGGDSYWIMCPYTSNEYMMRFMNSDGFILHTVVGSEKGVRAAVRIKEN